MTLLVYVEMSSGKSASQLLSHIIFGLFVCLEPQGRWRNGEAMFKSPFRNHVCITIVNGLSTAKPKCILVLLDKLERKTTGKRSARFSN